MEFNQQKQEKTGEIYDDTLWLCHMTDNCPFLDGV